MNGFHLACWNVTSWNRKNQEIIVEINTHNIDITFKNEKEKKSIRYQNHSLLQQNKD